MPFDYSDKAQLEALDRLCLQYGKRKDILIRDCPALRLLHERSTNSGITGGDLSRRLALALEIKLGSLHTNYYLSALAGYENEHLVPEIERRRYRPLEDPRSFSIAMMRSRAAFGLVIRIRSLWDKIFLYVALVTEGETTVRQLQSQKSKRKFFFSHFAAGFGCVTPEALVLAREALTRLEQNFRTPELHGFGNIKGWVFDTPSAWYSPHYSGQIIEHWNVLSDFLFDVFADCRTGYDSFDSKLYFEDDQRTDRG